MSQHDRRTFLKLTGAGALALGGARPRQAMAVPERATRQASASTVDVAVIGAGAFGGWTALYLQEMGHRVALIDAYGAGNARAASGGESRQIRTQYGEREIYTRWVVEAFDRWEARQREWGGRPLFYRTGQLTMARQWSTYLRTSKEVLDRHGVDNEVVPHDELPRRYPQFNHQDIEFGFYVPSTGVLMARRACFAVAGAVERAGGTLVAAKAQPGRQAGGRLQELTLSTGQSVSASTYVFACGPWLPKVFPSVMENKLQTPRRITFWYGVPTDDNRFIYPNCPTWDVQGAYGFPSIEGRGWKVAPYFDSIPFDPDTGERIVTVEEIEHARQFVRRSFPALGDQPVLESRVCQYENSVDQHFIVDQHPEMDNVWIVGGGSGHGYKHGIMMGDYVAHRVVGDDHSPELAETFTLKQDTF
ncbi:MAG TPA: FAD-dependent oxidoreductase [Acidobacteriota bacterium]|nr:FAD-dependent oxidoreductase [Acidobacteriota bacterium]